MEHVVWVVTPTVTNQLQRFSKRSHTKCLTSGFSAIGAALLAHWLFDSYGPTSPTPLTMYKPGATNDPQNPLSHFLPCVSHLLLGKKVATPAMSQRLLFHHQGGDQVNCQWGQWKEWSDCQQATAGWAG